MIRQSDAIWFADEWGTARPGIVVDKTRKLCVISVQNKGIIMLPCSTLVNRRHAA